MSLVQRLLEGSPQVLALFEKNPFDYPPRFIRATSFDYEFTTPLERKLTGNWWKRSNPRSYIPIVTLKNDRLIEVRHN